MLSVRHKFIQLSIHGDVKSYHCSSPDIYAFMFMRWTFFASLADLCLHAYSASDHTFCKLISVLFAKHNDTKCDSELLAIPLSFCVWQVDNLKAKLLEKLEDHLLKFLNESKAVDSDNTESSEVGKLPVSPPSRSPDGNVDSVTLPFPLSSFQ